ncbi:phosphotyrosine protein phosphatase [Caulobacter sp. RL271]|uniref:Phosphotyrosine protein phosphatase n=1 Tax=Caulobacter segnis TaxID=88688 RepID=A0ABY4ZT63_9CAUL|nr:phosphotyrosine protein phosphatase [Caulobacter segnis]USQ95824.1 phosphotyrosine protein phosphatase [Caulobacter segnis]
MAGIEVSSAGLDDGCGNPVTPEDLEWADLVPVMEQAHRNKLSRRFKPHLKNARVIVLGVPDDYEFMDPTLVQILQAKVPQFLRR